MAHSNLAAFSDSKPKRSAGLKLSAFPTIRVQHALTFLNAKGVLGNAGSKKVSARLDPGLMEAARAKIGMDNGSPYSGGLVGYAAPGGSISNAYATGHVTGGDALIGYVSSSTPTQLYYNSDTAGVSSNYGTGLTTSQFMGALLSGFGAAWATGAGLYPI